ncbi:peptide deformylase [Candidatus Peribacteria bacterium]|nr:peptide deformylase [Candidatus Peribacteria bacterium]
MRYTPSVPVLPIVIGRNTKVLRTKTKDVPKITKEIKELIRNMKQTTVAAKGAGLAAPQVNRSERICIAMISKKLTPLVNPNIIWRSKETDTVEEGCLSLPDLWLQITRSCDIIVKFLSETGKERELKLSDFDARVVQHEVDHLEGVLIVDYHKENLM